MGRIFHVEQPGQMICCPGIPMNEFTEDTVEPALVRGLPDTKYNLGLVISRLAWVKLLPY